jgi:hypothetical protein
MAVDPFKSNHLHGTQVTDAKAPLVTTAGTFVGYPYEVTIVGDGTAVTVSGTSDITIEAGVPTLKAGAVWEVVATLAGTTPVRVHRANHAFYKTNAGEAMVHTGELNAAAGNIDPVP